MAIRDTFQFSVRRGGKGKVDNVRNCFRLPLEESIFYDHLRTLETLAPAFTWLVYAKQYVHSLALRRQLHQGHTQTTRNIWVHKFQLEQERSTESLKTRKFER